MVMLERIKKLLFRIIYIFIEVFRLNGIRINSTAKLSCFGKIQANNFGDDLNLLFLGEITQKKIIYYPRSIISKFFGLDNYICIGSTIETRSNKTSIIWGAGMISSDQEFVIPKKIYAVRGKLTRQRFLDKGIECPPIYGDPVLLLPIYYKPNNYKKYELGIIPHYVDKRNKFIQSLLKNNENVVMIDVESYSDWHNVIDTIVSCRYIISSSLHGLIVSDAYNIPNLWVEYSKNITGNRFKFYDYYSSVNKSEEPLIIDRYYSVEELIAYCGTYKKISFDSTLLISSCPFKLKIK